MSNRNGVRWQAGDVILDLYKVIGILSQGELGEVYKVRHLGWQTDLIIQNLTPAAIERLGGIEQFEHQIKAWSNLGLYPHIVGCYYVRFVAEHPLIVTEYVAGDSLRRWIDDRRLYANGADAALQRILDVAIQWIWGLSYAYRQGVMHQAVTPESVLVTLEGEVRVKDFGLINPEAIAYRASEQINQNSLTVSTEVWSWGLSVLEMFAGGRIWTAETSAARTLEHYLENRTMAQLAGVQLPQMPVQVAQMLQRCFQENPDERPANLRDIASELQLIYWRSIGETYPRREPAAPDATSKGLADCLNTRAAVLWDLGEKTAALTLWEQAIAQQPQHLEAIYNRGLVVWRLGKASDVEILLELESSRSAHADWYVNYLLSLVHLERGDYEAALNLLESIKSSGIQQEEVTATLTLVKERLPYAKKLLPNFGAPQQRQSQDIASVALGVSHYALSGEIEGRICLWDIATSRILSVFRGHQGRVGSLAFSPDGCYVLSGGDDQTVQLWSVADTSHVHTFDGKERQVDYLGRQSRPVAALSKVLDSFSRWIWSNAHQGAVRSVVFSLDNRYILSGGDDSSIRLWEMRTGKCLQTLQGHWGSVIAVLFTPDQRHILSASVDQTIKLWKIATGQVVQTFMENHNLTSMSCSADGRYVVAGADPIKIWDITTGQLVQTFEAKGVRSVVFSPEGRFVLSAGDDQQLKLWEVASGRCLRTLSGHQSDIRAIAFSSEGDYALSAEATTLKWWAIFTGCPIDLAPLRLSQRQLADPQITGDRLYEQKVAQAQAALAQGDVLTAARLIRQARSQIGYSRTTDAVQVWLSLYTSLPRRLLSDSWDQVTFERYTEALRSVVFSPDSNCILTGSADTTLKLWEISTRRCLLSLEGHKNEVTAVAFSPVDRSALSGSADATLKLWNLSTGECLRTLVGHSDRVQSVALSPTGRYALSGSADTTLKLWEVATGRCLRTLAGHQGGVMAVAFSPDGRYALSGSADATLKRWHIATGDCISTFESHKAAIDSVAVSSDGRYVLSGGADQTLKLWNVTTGNCLRTFAGHTAAVRSISLSADGRYVLSGSNDKTCKLWNVSTGDCVWTFTGHTAAVRSVGLSADGRYALSGSEDKTCKLSLLDWELADSLPTDWDEGAKPYLEIFLQLHTPTAGVLPLNREPTPEEITLALTPQGSPLWTENNFSYLMQTLKVAGYGWLNPSDVRQQLSRLTQSRLTQSRLMQAIAQPASHQVLVQPDETAFATAFGTEFATLKDPDTSPKVVLTVTAGSLQGEEFEFSDRTICIIGRAKDCHLQLPNDEQHKTISRYHCLLDINPPIARIRDLGSLHGTYINGQMIGRRQSNQTPEQAIYNKFSEHDLASGDEVKLGQTVFRVKLEAEPVDDATALFFKPSTALGNQSSERSQIAFASNSVNDNGSTLTEIEGYTFLRQLSTGEAGEVYLARRNATQATVTLKIMLPQKVVPPSVIEMFLQQVESIKALQHPNIVQLLDCGYTSGAFFFALDYCDGNNIMDLMQQRGRHLPIDEAVAIALQALEGLEYAHNAAIASSSFNRAMGQWGLFHGDLKPTNILLTAGNSQVAKIINYGLVKAFDQAGLGGLSMSGTAADLPLFRPRQQAVNFNYASSEVDVWAIAACLYYMLTGTYPRNFSRDKDPYLVLLQNDPVSIREREAAIPRPLAELIDRALVDNPGITFKTAAAFKQALKAVV